jgi:hypothetical protein
MRVPRKKLYEEVWAEPMTTVAKRYEVSSSYLARICERLNIPRPGRGHWQQRAVGVDVKTDPLPEAQPGDEVEWARDGSTPAIAPMASTSRQPSDAGRPDKHPLLVGARGLFEDVRGGREVTYLVPRKTRLVDVFVTPATLDRALKLASDLFLFLEDRGHRVLLAPPGRGYQRAALNVREGAKPQYDYDHYERGRWQPVAPTTVLVGEVAIGVTIYETMEEVDSVWRNGKRVRYEPPKALPTPRRRASIVAQEHVSKHWFPTGRFGLHAYAAQGVAWEQTWIEKTAGELSGSFDPIAKALTEAGPKITKLLEERERERERQRKELEEQQKRWRREEEERRRNGEEAARLKRIQEAIASRRQALDIRAYVAEVKALIHDAGLEITKGGNAEEELAWAEAYADRIDPLSSWRRDIAHVKAMLASEPCTKCGAIHGPADESAADNTPPEAAKSADAPDPTSSPYREEERRAKPEPGIA